MTSVMHGSLRHAELRCSSRRLCRYHGCEVRGMPKFPIRKSVFAGTHLLLDFNWLCESGMSFGHMSLLLHSYFVTYFEIRRLHSPLFVTVCLDLSLAVGDPLAYLSITVFAVWQWHNSKFGSHLATKH